MELIRWKWKGHCSNSRKKGVMPLTFDEYQQKAMDAGITAEQIGNKTLDHYQLSRYTDSGDYTAGSCRFITMRENLAEMKINGGIARMSAKKRGRTKETCDGVARQAAKLTGRTAATHPGIAIISAKRSAALTGRTKETHEGIARMVLKNSKPFSFVAPDGTKHDGVNMNDFCKAHGLLGNAMCKLKSGRLKSYHGWTKG